jgi:Fe-S cluster assembly protein SufD
MVNTQNITDTISHYRAEFERSIQDAAGSPLADVRKSAMTWFVNKGFPARRDEEWRFTDIRPITDTQFTLAGFEQQNITESQVGAALFPELKANRLVFVNGRYAAHLSQVQELPPGVVIGSLAEAVRTQPGWVEKYLAREPNAGLTAFVTLNEAFLEDGAFVHIKRGVVVPDPIFLLFVSNPGEGPTVSHPRTIVHAEAGSQATVVESYVGAGEGAYFTNAVTDIYVDDNAVLDHYKLNHETNVAYHVAATQIELQRAANFTSHSITLGGLIVRNDFNAGLRGEGIECTLNGLYIGRDRQLIDNHTSIDHAMPHCNSHEVYKGVLDGRARGVFNGKIFVRLDAQKTDAKQTNQTLLLSPDATINTKPQLEILANDVRCTHGATVGQLNADALFYLRSRGIGKEQARALLTFAFANDIVNRIKVDPVREALEHALLMELNS